MVSEPEAPFRFAVDEAKLGWDSYIITVYLEDDRFPPLTYGGSGFHLFPHILKTMTAVYTPYEPLPFLRNWQRDRIIRKSRPKVLAKIDHNIPNAYAACGIPLTGPLPDGMLNT